MCGIAGIVAFDPRDRVDERRLTAMSDVMRHRGPDGDGLYIDGPVGLAHRRLSIVDVSGGQQPMSNEDASVWVVFNGEIYNHTELRPGLEQRGHHYRTRSDTETILHLYEEKGDRVVEDLHGMFAFAVWDRPRRRLLLARDRLGIKPLYYTVTGNELLFASEIKSLLAASRSRPSFNRERLPEFLATRFLSGEETFFRGIRKLMPGHVASWSLQPLIQHVSSFEVAAIIGSIETTIDHVKKSVSMIIGVAAQDIVCAAVNPLERAVLQTNKVKQIDGVEVELEVAIVAEHLERNRDDGLRRKKDAVEIVSAREPRRIDVPADLQ